MPIVRKILSSKGASAQAGIALLSAFVMLSISCTDVRASVADVKRDIDRNKVTEKTFAEMQKILKGDPDNADLHLLLGRCYDAAGMRDMARESFVEAHRLDPSKTQVVLEAFKRKFNGTKPATGFNDWVQIRKTYATDNDVRLMETLVYALFGTVAAAESSYLSERNHGHDLMGIATLLSQVRSSQKNFAKALELAESDLAMHPNDDNALIAKATALNGLGQYERAAFVMLPLHRLYPLQFGTGWNLATSYHHMGKHELALKPALFNLAAVGTSPEKVDPAIRKVVEILPHVSSAARSESMKAVATMLDQTAYRSNYHYALGRAFEQYGDLAAATREYQAATIKVNSDPKHLFALGRVYEAQGEYKEALQTLMAAQTGDPDAHDIMMALRRLEMRLINQPNDLAMRMKDMLRPR